MACTPLHPAKAAAHRRGEPQKEGMGRRESATGTAATYRLDDVYGGTGIEGIAVDARWLDGRMGEWVVARSASCPCRRAVRATILLANAPGAAYETGPRTVSKPAKPRSVSVLTSQMKQRFTEARMDRWVE